MPEIQTEQIDPDTIARSLPGVVLITNPDDLSFAELRIEATGLDALRNVQRLLNSVLPVEVTA